jgi:hypothetical protein
MIPGQVSVLFSRDARAKLWGSLRRRPSSSSASIVDATDLSMGSPASFYSALGLSESTSFRDYGTTGAYARPKLGYL